MIENSVVTFSMVFKQQGILEKAFAIDCGHKHFLNKISEQSVWLKIQNPH